MTSRCHEIEDSVHSGIRDRLTESWVALSGHIFLILLVNVVDNRSQATLGETTPDQNARAAKKINEKHERSGGD